MIWLDFLGFLCSLKSILQQEMQPFGICQKTFFKFFSIKKVLLCLSGKITDSIHWVQDPHTVSFHDNSNILVVFSGIFHLVILHIFDLNLTKRKCSPWKKKETKKKRTFIWGTNHDENEDFRHSWKKCKISLICKV